MPRVGWQHAWWIRVDNGPHMRSVRGRRRTWRATEQVRDGNSVEESQNLAEKAVGKKWKREKDGQDRAVRTLCTSSFTCQQWQQQQAATTTAETAATSSSRSNADTAAEEATTGALKLTELFPKDELLFLVIKVNDFLTKSEFDIVYSCCHLVNDGVMRV